MKRSLRLQVRSGTVTGFSSMGFPDTVKNRNITWMELGEGKAEIIVQGKPNKKGEIKETVKEEVFKTVSILNKNAVKGILYKLTGHLDKINVCDEFSPLSKLINSLEYKVELKQKKASLNSVGQKFKVGNAETPSPDMNLFNIDHLRDDLKIYKKHILSIVKSNNLKDLTIFLYDKSLSEEVTSSLIKESKRLLTELNKKHPSKFFETLLGKIDNKINNEPVSGWKISDNMLTLLNSVLNTAKEDEKFLNDILEKSKSTFFDATFKNWLKEKPTVIQGVEYGYKIDFDILINNVPDEFVDALENGPGTASWAKRGLVTPIVEDFPFIYKESDGLSDKIVLRCGRGDIV
jgi:hypothetical protein